MDICMICGMEYDPALEPDHEDRCQERLAAGVNVEVKADPALKNLLEGLLNGKEED